MQGLALVDCSVETRKPLRLATAGGDTASVKAEDDLRLGNRSVLGLEADFQGSHQWSDGGFGFASFTDASIILPVAFTDRLVWFGTVRGPPGSAFDSIPSAKFQYLGTLMAHAAAEVHAEIRAAPIVVERS